MNLHHYSVKHFVLIPMYNVINVLDFRFNIPADILKISRLFFVIFNRLLLAWIFITIYK